MQDVEECLPEFHAVRDHTMVYADLVQHLDVRRNLAEITEHRFGCFSTADLFEPEQDRPGVFE